ncbi:MAG: cysteine--tRNA ligase [Chlamydiota bacterium]|nr:cysteine--tRNA ligase [Chlamydiota bacterium]
MLLSLYNSLTREIEPLTLQPGRDSMSFYACGPTVYDHAHLGNLRTYVAEDLLRRTIEWWGYPIQHVMNLTDVDDKTLLGAKRSGQSLSDYTAPYIASFLSALETLSIKKPEVLCAATDHIPDMIAMIEKLMKKGIAYCMPSGDVCFRISDYPKYGAFCHMPCSHASHSPRIEDEYLEESAADFALWKAYDPERDGAIFWESPFGPGRPGWHIECSAMATHFLPLPIDLHAGGVDNRFPHHENEIAQTEAAMETPFVRHWFHVEHLLVEGEKMSKSKGNFYTLNDLIQKGHSPDAIRFLLLSTHYRTSLNLTMPGLQAAKQSLERLREGYRRLLNPQKTTTESNILEAIEKAKGDFQKALGNDLNISLALATLFTLFKQLHAAADQNLLGEREASAAKEWVESIDPLFGGIITREEAPPPHDIMELLRARNRARDEKSWDIADQLRERIESAGYLIEDGPTGSRLKKGR